VELRWDVHTIHLRHPFILSDSHITQRNTVIVRVTSDGIDGLGEAAPSTYFGESCDSVLSVFEDVSKWLRHSGRTEPLQAIDNHLAHRHPAAPSARSGIIMAIADWKARSLDIPVWKLLELDTPPSRPTSFTIGIDEPEKLRTKLAEASNFSVLKIKMGRGAQDYEILQTVRAMTDKPLRIDANEGWTFDEAVRKLDWLKSHNIEMVEQPLAKEDVAQMALVRTKSTLPLFGDENIRGFSDLDQWGNVFDGVNIKLDKCGGLLEAVRMMKKAKSIGLLTMLGCMVQTSVGIAAAAQLSALADYVDLDGHLLITDDPYRGLEVDGGNIVVPERPGLGLLPC